MKTSCSCSANCHSCNKVANECGAVKERQNPDSEISSLFSRTGFGVDASKSPFGSIDNPNPNPNQVGLGDKCSIAFRGCVPSNFHATSSWTQSSVFGPSKTTTPFDRSATPFNPFNNPPILPFDRPALPLNPFSVPPISKDTSTAFGWKPTTQPHAHAHENGKTQVCNECGSVKASQNPFAPSSTGTGTGTGAGGFEPGKSSSEGFVPSNSLATTSWTHSSAFGPSKTTTPFGFDFSATPLHSFKFPPTSKDTTASGDVWKQTTQPQALPVSGHKAYSGTVCPYEDQKGMIVASISAMMPLSHEELRFQHYQLQGKPTPAVGEFSKSTITAEPQPQLTLPIFVLTMMGSSVGFTQIGTLPATPSTNGNGITISASPTFGSPATIASFGTGPPQPSWGSHLFGTGPPPPSFGSPLFGAPATTAPSFPQNAAYGHN